MDKKLVFFFTAWLVLVEVLCNTDSMDNSTTEMTSMYEQIYEEMLTALTSSYSQPASRHKRDLSSGGQSLIDDSGVFRLSSVKPVAVLCYPAIRTLFLDVSDTTYAVCLSEQTAETPAEVFVGHYREHAWTPVYKWMVQNPTDVAAFYYKENIYVIITDLERPDGADLMKIDLKTGNVRAIYTAHGKHPTSIAVWKMKNTYNMALANSVAYKDANTAAYKDATDLGSEILVYEWKETYFDKYASFPAYYVTDIEPFNIHGRAFMAIANFKRTKTIKEVDSEILRYDMDGNTWTSHQKIRTYAAMDFEFFSLGTSLGQDFFLAVANKGYGTMQGKSMIYKFVEDKFRPFQCLQTTKATSVASYSVDSTFVLAIANENDAVHLYQYDGWMFVKSIQSTTGAMSNGVVNLNFHRVMRNSAAAVIMSVSNSKQPRYQSVFEMGFTHENVLQDWHGRGTDWCLRVLSKIEKTDIDKSIGNFDDVIFTDQPSISIDGDIVFEQGFEVETLKTPKLTETSTEEVYDDSLLVKLADLHKRLQAVQEKLTRFAAAISNSLKTDGIQNITSELNFQDAVFDCEVHNCHFENIYTDVLNGEEISDWSHQLVFLDSDQIIKGTLHAKEINATSIHVNGLVDGIRSEHLVTKSGHHNITGHKIFESSITVPDLQVTGIVDGVKISAEDVLLTTGLQRVYGNLTFEDIKTSWLKTTNVNGRDFSKFYNDLVLKDKSYTITGIKTFNDVTIDELTMKPGAKINGVDLVDLWKNVLWKDGYQTITADMTFSDVLVKKDLKAMSGINGIQIPGPRVVDISEPANITAPTLFENTTKINRLQVLESLNGIRLVPAPDGSEQLDILLKSGEQLITGVKTFHTIHLDADSYVGGQVDGVDLSDFKASALHKDSSLHSDDTWVFKNLVVKGPLDVKGYISGINLQDVYETALKLDDTKIPEMIFNELVFVDNLESNNINDINIKKDLVLRNEPQVITGTKTFDKIVLKEDSVVKGLVNSMDFSFFNDILLRIGNQNLKSKVFKKNVIINDLTVTGSINDVPVEDIVTLKGGHIYGSRVLKNVSFSNIEAKNVEVTGKVNDIDLKEMINDTMTYDGAETVLGKKEFTGTIYVTNGSNLQTKDLNGVDLAELWADAVFLDVPQPISGTKTFSENVVFNSLSFDSTLDGVSEWDMRHNWMLRNTPQIVEGDVIFENGFSAKDLLVGTLNGVDIESLNSSIVKVNEEAEIEGPVIFENTVFSNGSITLSGKIQGIDLSEEAVLRDSIIIDDKKIFNDLVIEGDMSVDGTIDGIFIEELCKKAILGNKEQTISKLIIKGNVTLAGGGTIGGSLAGVDLKLLEEVAVKNDGSSIKFSGLKKFSNVTFEGPVELKGKIGGVDLDFLAKNYLSLTKPQEILAKMEFDDLAFEGALSVENLNTVNQEINGINLKNINDRVLKTSGTQNITAVYNIDEVVFEDDVFVAGKVNCFELPSGLMIHNRTNYIQSPKIFEKPVIVSEDLDMEVGKLIQGVDVSDWFQKAVKTDGRYEIYGIKSFKKLGLNDVTAEGLFDGLKISEDNLLMTYGNQVVKGRKVIVGNVSIEGSLTVDGLINNVDLLDLSKKTLQRDRNNTVTGLKHFTKPLTIVSLQASTVAGVDIRQLQEKLSTPVNFDNLEDRLDEIESVVAHMQNAFDNQAVVFQYYELFDEFSIPSAYNWLYVSGEDCGELLLLSDNSSSVSQCSSLRLFAYDQKLNRFVPSRQELLTSYAVSVKTLSIGKSTYLFVANQNPRSPCSSANHIGKETVDIYTWNVDSFKRIQSLFIYKPVDMVVFKDYLRACLVVLEYNGSTVHCYSEENQNFTLTEVLFSSGGRKASVIDSLGKTFLAIAAEDNSIPRQNYIEGQKYVVIYAWDSDKAEFSAPKQVIQSTFAQSIALMNLKDKYSEILFLIVAEGSIPKIHNEPKIIVYAYDPSEMLFQKQQEIPDYGTLEWVKLNTGELMFFAVNSLNGVINVYQHKGVSGFVRIDTVKSLGTTSLHPFVRTRKEDWLNHYLALAGPRCLIAHPSQGDDYAKILKSKVKGKRAFY